MASKKRDDGGSNFGLIITLVFFVLSTVILGITTYLSYAEIEKKDKDKVAAETKSKEAQTERDYYRLKANVLGVYSGDIKPAGRSLAELAPEKKQLAEGTFPNPVYWIVPSASAIMSSNCWRVICRRVSRSFTTPRTLDNPASTRPCSVSLNRTVIPCWTATDAMPAPMNPVPSTPIFLRSVALAPGGTA